MPPFKDLTNQKFGKLVVMGRAPSVQTTGGQVKTRWLCRCECNKEKVARSQNLLLGNTQSCGECAIKANNAAKYAAQFVGRRYGHVTIVSRTEDRKCGHAVYECHCDYGNTHYATLDSLKRGSACGCRRRQVRHERNTKRLTQYVGQNLGGGVILRITDQSKSGKRLCEVQCPFCPDTYLATPCAMSCGNNQSCGCYQSRMMVERHKSLTAQYVGQDLGGGKVLRLTEVFKHNSRLVEVQCPFCENTYNAVPHVMLSGKTQSCGCIKNSSGEALIERWLKNNDFNRVRGCPSDLTYDREVRFAGCRNKFPLPFDFAVKTSGTLRLIEFQGQHHYEAVRFGRDIRARRDDHVARFAITKRRDRIKVRWASRNGYPLLRIHYRRKKDIPTLLADFLKGGQERSPACPSPARAGRLRACQRVARRA